MSLYKGNNLISGTMPNSANQSLSNLDSAGQDKFDAKVNKSGDTMTGMLAIATAGTDQALALINTNDNTTSAPSENQARAFRVFNNNSTLLGDVRFYHLTDGSTRAQLVTRNYITGSQVDGAFSVIVSSSGVASCTFPNTTCVDGRYVNMSPATTIATNVSINGSSSLSYTLNLPKDGHNYMVWMIAEGDTGTTSGNYINIKLGSDIMIGTTVARATTRTASTVAAGGTVCLVVSSSHKIYLGRASNWNGKVSLYMVGYRRIGTNS